MTLSSYSSSEVWLSTALLEEASSPTDRLVLTGVRSSAWSCSLFGLCPAGVREGFGLQLASTYSDGVAGLHINCSNLFAREISPRVDMSEELMVT